MSGRVDFNELTAALALVGASWDKGVWPFVRTFGRSFVRGAPVRWPPSLHKAVECGGCRVIAPRGTINLPPVDDIDWLANSITSFVSDLKR